MSEVLIRVHGTAFELFAGPPRWVEHVEVQRAGLSDSWLVLTTDRSKARRFASIEAAFETWREVLQRDPIRPEDGKPNRPLTAFSIGFDNIGD